MERTNLSLEIEFTDLLKKVEQRMIDDFQRRSPDPTPEQCCEFEKQFKTDPYRQAILDQIIFLNGINLKPIMVIKEKRLDEIL